MKLLFLDDSQMRHNAFQRSLRGTGHQITAVMSADDACDAMKKTAFDVVFLDRDLNDFDGAGSGPGGDESTGEDVAQWMVDSPHAKQPKQVVVHSVNPVGGPAILQILSAAGFRCGLAPFGSPDFSGILAQLRANQTNPSGA
jgi:CheY-like chemotaxis protein